MARRALSSSRCSRCSWGLWCSGCSLTSRCGTRPVLGGPTPRGRPLPDLTVPAPASSRSSERHAHRPRDLRCGRGANQASPARPAGTAIGPSVAALRRCPRYPVGTGLRGAMLPGSDSDGNWAALTNEGLRGTVGRHAKGRIPAEIRVIPAEIRVTTRGSWAHTGPGRSAGRRPAKSCPGQRFECPYSAVRSSPRLRFDQVRLGPRQASSEVYSESVG